MESRLLRCSDFIDLHKQFMEENKGWPENSTFAYWWQTLEDRFLRRIEGVICASTTSLCSLHFDGFMIHKNVQDFLHQLAQWLMDTVGFQIPFAAKEHFSFTQALRAQDGREDRALPVEHQGEHGASVSTSPRVFALGFTTGGGRGGRVHSARSTWLEGSAAVGVPMG